MFPRQTIHTHKETAIETKVVKCDESYMIPIQTDESERTPMQKSSKHQVDNMGITVRYVEQHTISNQSP